MKQEKGYFRHTEVSIPYQVLVCNISYTSNLLVLMVLNKLILV